MFGSCSRRIYSPPFLRLHSTHSPFSVSFTMFRLEDSANITASPQPFGEPSSRRRPLSETEFPRSETSPASPQAIPPLPPRTPASPLPPPRPTVFPPLPPLLPPRPTAFPHPFPGVSGPRRQSTRQNTYDSYAPEGSAPGGGVGGFRRLLPFNLRSYSNPPQYESGDITGGVHAGVWPIYNEKSQKYDDEMSKKWISELDNLLIFVSIVFWPSLIQVEITHPTVCLVLCHRHCISHQGPRRFRTELSATVSHTPLPDFERPGPKP